MKMKKLNIAIIGLGLIGGSLGLLIKKRTQHTVRGFSRSQKTIQKAKQIKSIDIACKTPKETVVDADIIFIATPISQISQILKQIKNHVPKDAIITDVASTKKRVLKLAQNLLPKKSNLSVAIHWLAKKQMELITQRQICLKMHHGY